MSKTTSAEFKAFYKSDDPAFWPEGSWIDEMGLVVDGVEHDGEIDVDAIPDAATVKIAHGIVRFSEREKAPASLTALFRRWHKAQTAAYLSVEVPKEKLEAVRAAIKAAGGRVR